VPLLTGPTLHWPHCSQVHRVLSPITPRLPRRDRGNRRRARSPACCVAIPRHSEQARPLRGRGTVPLGALAAPALVPSSTSGGCAASTRAASGAGCARAPSPARLHRFRLLRVRPRRRRPAQRRPHRRLHRDAWSDAHPHVDHPAQRDRLPTVASAGRPSGRPARRGGNNPSGVVRGAIPRRSSPPPDCAMQRGQEVEGTLALAAFCARSARVRRQASRMAHCMAARMAGPSGRVASGGGVFFWSAPWKTSDITGTRVGQGLSSNWHGTRMCATGKTERGSGSLRGCGASCEPVLVQKAQAAGLTMPARCGQ